MLELSCNVTPTLLELQVVIFERTGRVGGKCYDVDHDGMPHALAAILLDPNYYAPDGLVPWLQQYGLADDIIKAKAQDGLWVTNSASDLGSKSSIGQYVLATISTLTNSTSKQENVAFLIETLIRYVKLHRELFESYDGNLMRRPSEKVLRRIRGTVLQFLKRENLLALVPAFTFAQTVPGYGKLDEVAALYALIWTNPTSIVARALSVLLNAHKIPFTAQSFKSGFESKVKAVAKMEKLDIRLLRRSDCLAH